MSEKIDLVVVAVSQNELRLILDLASRAVKQEETYLRAKQMQTMPRESIFTKEYIQQRKTEINRYFEVINRLKALCGMPL